MGPPKIPPEGLVLHHDLSDKHPYTTSKPSQAFRIELAREKRRKILASLQKNEKIHILFGKKPRIQYGKESIRLNVEPSSFPAELYARSNTSNHHYYFSGKLSHTVEVREAQEATATADRALAALESSLKLVQSQRAANETTFVPGKAMSDKKTKGQKSGHLQPIHSSALHRTHLFDGVTRSTPSSPFLGASLSPRPTPTSAPATGFGLSDKDKVQLNAMRIPLVHLLAVAPATMKSLAKRIRAPIEDVERVLAKIAADVNGKKELKDSSYKELDVWKFPYESQEDRQTAINRAVRAFDRMRIAHSNDLWQLLLKEEERGKGKVLSRLDLNRPKQRPVTTESKSPQHDVHEEGDSEVGRGRLQAPDIAKGRARSNEPLQRKKVSEKETLSKQTVRKDALSQLRDTYRERAKVNAERSLKANPKYKSAEYIEDSDDEADSANDVPIKPESTVAKRDSSMNRFDKQKHRQPPKESKKISHKSALSSSSNEDHVPGGKQGTGSGPSKVRPGAEKPVPRNASRPRTTSSPQKPSPLSSSPPTNSSDLDNSSSEKAPSASSMTSSPPSSSDIPLAKKNNFSPVVTETKDRPERGRSPVKRKAGPNENEPPPKRQQQQPQQPSTGAPTNKDIIGDSGPRPKAPQRQSSDASSGTGSSLSPEKPEHRIEELLDKSKRFQLYYKRYKELHDKVSSSTEEDEQETRELWKMHNRLKELKDEIWGDWRKLGEPGRIDI